MKWTVSLLTLVLVLVGRVEGGERPVAAAFRPPAVPLVTHDPYFSVWSFEDRLTDGPTRHWTGQRQELCALVKLDGAVFRLMGAEPAAVPAMKQVSLEVLPTRTIYHFEEQGVRIGMIFCSPLLPDEPEVMSRPVSYLTWEVRVLDRKQHEVSLYFDCGAGLAVDREEQAVTWERERVETMSVLRVGTQQQAVLGKSGDNVRIDWGYMLLGVPQQGNSVERILGASAARGAFAAGRPLPEQDDTRMPRPAKDDQPVLCCVFDLGALTVKAASRHVLLGYDDIYSVEYFGQRLRPWWRRKGLEPNALLRRAEQDYAMLQNRCGAFDVELMINLRRRGGVAYMNLGALAFRQCLAAHKLVSDPNGQALMFSKENFSNGCMGTVDVMYPSSPLFLLFNPKLLQAQLTPVFDYARSSEWRFSFAPHDLGTYPKANGQVYGGGSREEKDQMPVEESANMILMTAALTKATESPAFALRYWTLLAKWAAYLKEKGLDPEEQLCTDDFAGHLAHNANLSLKAIMALGAFAQLADAAGRLEEASAYRATAQEMVAAWMAKADDGDRYRLAFDRPGTWSQKYNLVWDRILGLGLFPPEVALKELAFYRTVMNRYGLPLDHRKDYTKADWLVWTAALTEKPRELVPFVQPIYDYLHESPSRVPFSDWYDTKTGKAEGFQARSVVGGVFMPMLSDPGLWRKWSSRAKQ